ncbi:sensor histidine kinase [Paraliobacillus sediminis]|uniref:sensor histidine kinase n=1 Tax=Paraliobacillus sediminis TaxID=1885916 RepID=UPI000E3C0BDB|nr:HAMP domain-containing sensor histidine kinase [Paraliobacillus sediminis]
MLRNKEIRYFLIAISAISILAIGLATVMLSFEGVLFIVIVSVLFISCSLFFTKWRYQEIEKLSSYLRRITNGEYSLDVRDNYEGELSILKSDIYKVTLMLSEQGSLLKEDKIKLTNAISDISHQLKTPLTSMMLMADLLSDQELNGLKRVEFTRNIRVQLERMDWLVSTLLKLSKIDAGTVVFKQETFPVFQLIQKALEPVLIPMDIKQQTIKLDKDESVLLIGDFNWTSEALINILKNCVEHSGSGGTIKINYLENPLYTEIMIEDDGKGIAKEDLPYIFKRFYKGKNASEDSVGIGLAMAYSIITKQHGDIQVFSDTGKGTRFQIKFYKQVI